MKICNRCGHRLPLEAFWACRRAEDGRQKVCKECEKERFRREWPLRREKRLPMMAEYNKTYYRAHREQMIKAVQDRRRGTRKGGVS